jgi:hypothetical protein
MSDYPDIRMCFGIVRRGREMTVKLTVKVPYVITITFKITDMVVLAILRYLLS